jgi:hypothetical protein
MGAIERPCLCYSCRAHMVRCVPPELNGVQMRINFCTEYEDERAGTGPEEVSQILPRALSRGHLGRFGMPIELSGQKRRTNK